MAARWLTYRTDDGAKFDRSIKFDAAAFAPQVTWGTNPGMVTEVTSKVPIRRPSRRDLPACGGLRSNTWG